jgi:DGQHR domain-containing protein
MEIAMPSIPVQRFRQTHKGQPIDLYLAALPAAEVIRRQKIDIQTPDNPGGYQRRPESHRLVQIAKYIARGEGLLPTAVLVNIRQGAWFEENNPGDSFGQLHFSDDQQWWIEDGQHRILGVQEAIGQAANARRPVDFSYDLPVVFCLGFNRTEEMDLFEIVNSKAKGVPTDLVASIIFNRVTEERGKPEPGKISLPQLRKAVGVAVGHYLGDSDPWKGHIQEVNESKDVVNKPMQANTFASTLLPTLRERWVHTRFLTNPKDPKFNDLAKVVLTYWRALAELMPEAFADIAHYSVQRPIGVYAFHELLPEVMDACRMEGDWSLTSFKNKLQRLAEWVESSTWHRENGVDIVKGSGNRAAIRVVVERMRTLYHAPLTGLPE